MVPSIIKKKKEKKDFEADHQITQYVIAVMKRERHWRNYNELGPILHCPVQVHLIQGLNELDICYTVQILSFL